MKQQRRRKKAKTLATNDFFVHLNGSQKIALIKSTLQHTHLRLIAIEIGERECEKTFMKFNHHHCHRV